MKKLILVLALVFVASCASVAQNATVDIYANVWNLVSAPRVPFNPDPHGSTGVFGNAFTNAELSGRLFRMNPLTGSQSSFSAFNAAAFGKILIGEAYYLNNAGRTARTLSYAAVPNGIPDSLGNKTDMWVSLPGLQQGNGGWHWVGTPFAQNIPVGTQGANIRFTDGTEVKTWSQAVSAGWVLQTMTWINNVGVQRTLGYAFANDNQMRPGRGYLLKTNKDNLAMIINAIP